MQGSRHPDSRPRLRRWSQASWRRRAGGYAQNSPHYFVCGTYILELFSSHSLPQLREERHPIQLTYQQYGKKNILWRINWMPLWLAAIC